MSKIVIVTLCVKLLLGNSCVKNVRCKVITATVALETIYFLNFVLCTVRAWKL
jgi:hypothetical protein